MSQPQVSQITQTTIPDYAKPYVENLLGIAQGTAFQYKSDPSKPDGIARDAAGLPIPSGFQPYQPYQGQRFAQFSPLQQQAFAQAGQMRPSEQLEDASSLAGLAGLRALNYGYTPQQQSFTQPNTAAAYMSPYMQNVVDVEQREAARRAGIADTQRGAKFAQAGAFGGGRQAIENAEAARNLSMQQGDIQSRGMQAAYQQAQQQFNTEQQLREQASQFGAGLGLQGLQSAMTGAGQLGQLGQNQYIQNMGINQLMGQYGGQQQQQAQNILNAQYQDFLNMQNQPYKQLGFMSDMLRGLPLSQSASTMYQQPPSMGSQLVGLGTAAAGFGKLFAKGGAVDSRPAGLADLAISRMG
jgi:hypothetical protein